jgi:hypothetical protein
MLTRLVRRLTYWARFRSHQAELAEELALHRELLADDLRRQGLSPETAAAAARRAMGNETLMRENARDVWLAAGLDAVQRDIRAYATSRVLGAFLYDVAPSDPASLGSAVLLMAGVALVATAMPLRRALRIDPLDALRTD